MMILLTACQYSPYAPAPTSVILTPSPTSSFTPTVTFWKAPIVTATPISASITTDEDLENLIEQLYPFCIGVNILKTSSPSAPSRLEFIESDVKSNLEGYRILEIADNSNGSLQAFVACKAELCQEQVYVTDNMTGKTYEVDWDYRLPWRPIQRLTWINNDLLAFYQPANPSHGSIKLISYSEKEYLFSAMVLPESYCSTPVLN